MASKTKDYLMYSIIVTGPRDAGSSALAVHYCYGIFTSVYSPLSIEPYRTLRLVDNDTLFLEIDDNRELSSYYRNIHTHNFHGLMLTFSLDSYDSFSKLLRRCQELKANSTHDLSTKAVVLVGNKADKLQEPVKWAHEIEQLRALLGCSYFETSAKTGLNVHEAFDELSRRMVELQKDDPKTSSDTVVAARASSCILA